MTAEPRTSVCVFVCRSRLYIYLATAPTHALLIPPTVRLLNSVSKNLLDLLPNLRR